MRLTIILSITIILIQRHMAEQLRRRRALQREKEYIEEQRLDGRAAARAQVTTSITPSPPLRLLSNHPLYPSILCYIQQLIITIVLMFLLFIPAFVFS